jgi:hypothetical protein
MRQHQRVGITEVLTYRLVHLGSTCACRLPGGLHNAFDTRQAKDPPGLIRVPVLPDVHKLPDEESVSLVTTISETPPATCCWVSAGSCRSSIPSSSPCGSALGCCGVVMRSSLSPVRVRNGSCLSMIVGDSSCVCRLRDRDAVDLGSAMAPALTHFTLRPDRSGNATAQHAARRRAIRARC